MVSQKLKLLVVEDSAEEQQALEGALSEIEENEFNLNIPRYVDTFEPEQEINLKIAISELQQSQSCEAKLKTELETLLNIFNCD